MKIAFKSNFNELVDEYMEVGYLCDSVEVENLQGEELIISSQRKDRLLQLLISYPNLKEFSNEIVELDRYFDDLKIEMKNYLIFSSKDDFAQEIAKKLNNFEVVIDRDREFGEIYGTLYVNGELESQLTKSLFLIGKDGALYHEDMPLKLEDNFKFNTLASELNRAYVAYTGVGCHG